MPRNILLNFARAGLSGQAAVVGDKIPDGIKSWTAEKANIAASTLHRHAGEGGVYLGEIAAAIGGGELVGSTIGFASDVAASNRFVKAAAKSEFTELGGVVAETKLHSMAILESSELSHSFPITEAVEISGRRAIDMGTIYEQQVVGFYKDFPSQTRIFDTTSNGKLVSSIVDHAIKIQEQRVAIEVKFVDDWNKSIRNPESAIGKKDFTQKVHVDMINQARRYTSGPFDEVIYHTNSAEFASFYSVKFRENGITNFKFVITPIKGNK